ncbi:MAG: hypothetical protein LH631_07900, partial [Alkalinema sp. CAN_BIN05]|nr:hypothetical protein [Alkalinema sp. CAN_BIN05]
KSDESIQTYTKEKIKASSLKKLASIASKHQDNWLSDLIESDLKVKIPIANLKDLLIAKSTYGSINNPKIKTLELFNNFITQQVKEEIELISLEKIVSLMRSHEDGFFISLIEPNLEEKIRTADLEDLLVAKSAYKLIDEPKSTILKLLDDSITQQVRTTSFEDLLGQRGYWDEINDELIEPILKNNASAIIDGFAKSSSFGSAGSNSRLLVKIAEYLSPTQWENILEAFFENDQLYCSYSAYGEFESLFKKSLELSNFVQHYWLSFREKLNKFNNKYSNSLKRLFDSHT